MDINERIEYIKNGKSRLMSIDDFKNLTKFEKDEIDEYLKVYYLGETMITEYVKKPDSRFNYNIDDNIDYRYQIKSLLGCGAFGDVLSCLDHKTNETVAVKLVKDEPRFHRSCENEIRILNIISKKSKYLISLERSFKFRGHDCLVFEQLNINLYQFLKKREYKGLDEAYIRNITRQILFGLSALKDYKIIHGDLKPENIMFTDNNLLDIKIVDLGSSFIYESNNMYQTYVQTRWYRSPEVILGYPIDYQIDLWSFACILFELADGKPIFTGKNVYSQIYRFYHYLGEPSPKFLKMCKFKDKYFKDGSLSIKTIKNSSNNHPMYFKTINNNISNIVRKVFRWEPDKRPDVNDLLNLQWFNEY